MIRRRIWPRRKKQQYFSLTRGFFLYLFLIAAAVVITQLSRSVIATVVLVFLLLFPPVEIGLFLYASGRVTFSFQDGRRTAVRGKDAESMLRIPFTIYNECFFPVSLCEISFWIPQKYALHSYRQTKKLSLPGNVKITADFGMQFENRGCFRVGVEEIVLSDFFHLIRWHNRAESYAEVLVLPRQLPLHGVFPVLMGTSTSREMPERHDQMDYGDIREYRVGDPIKSVHWKLSTKADELQVRERTSDTGKSVLILCDLGNEVSEGSAFPPHAGIYADDAVAEEALSAALEAAHYGAYGQLILPEGEECRPYSFSDQKTAKDLAIPLAMAHGRLSVDQVRRLFNLQNASYDVTVLYVAAYFSPAMEENLRSFLKAAAGFSFRVCLCGQRNLLPEKARESYAAELREFTRRLLSEGILVTVPHRREEKS